jgi:hypothetical protein
MVDLTMEYRLIKPIGYYPPLIWRKDLTKKPIGGLSLRLLTLGNLLLRFTIYPFNFLVSSLITLGSVVAATFFNLGWLLGGGFSNFWSNTTKALNQTAITRCQWLIFDGLGFLWNQAKLFAGLFYSPFAVSTLTQLKEFAEPLTKTSLFHLDWQEPHQKRIKALAKSFNDHGLHSLKMFVCTLAAEPVESILFGLRLPRGFGNLSNYGLNPSKLTPAQAQYPALLCLHGNYHNQSAWLPLAKYLYNKKYPGPIFTLNLPAGSITQQDTKLINEKIESIKTCYRESNGNENSLKINLIGHSRGAHLVAYRNYYRFEENSINKTILIGFSPSTTLVEFHKKTPPTYPTYYINGRYDALLFFNTLPKDTDGHLVNTGHLGLLSHPETLEQCYSTLNTP